MMVSTVWAFPMPIHGILFSFNCEGARIGVKV